MDDVWEVSSAFLGSTSSEWWVLPLIIFYSSPFVLFLPHLCLGGLSFRLGSISLIVYYPMWETWLSFGFFIPTGMDGGDERALKINIVELILRKFVHVPFTRLLFPFGILFLGWSSTSLSPSLFYYLSFAALNALEDEVMDGKEQKKSLKSLNVWMDLFFFWSQMLHHSSTHSFVRWFVHSSIQPYGSAL